MSCVSPNQVKESLLSTIDSLWNDRNLFLANPEKDFTRTKKISFAKTILFPMIAGSDNVETELLDFFGEKAFPTPSSMIQRRNQIHSSAFKELFYRFTDKIPILKKQFGLRILACDGSRINLPFDPRDKYTYIHYIKDRKGINQVHLNALYDPLNDFFVDAELQPVPQLDEKAAFCHFLKSYGSDQKTLFIADRGYASYHIFATAIHLHRYFLIRIPQSFALSISTERDSWLSHDEEDLSVTVHIGRRRLSDSSLYENYHYFPKRRHYDFIEPGSSAVDILKFRVLKFPIADNSFEYIVTNLPSYFSIDKIKFLYRIRWGVETAFRHLKYAGNMVHIHSLKTDFLFQEIFAKLTFYNFSSFMAASVRDSVEKSTDKYRYVLNHTQVLKSSLRFLRGSISDFLSAVKGSLVPVRPGRSFNRNMRRQSADTLAYR